MNQLVMGVLAIVGIVIVAMALSGTQHEVAVIIQMGLVIAIIALLVRDSGNSQKFFAAWKNLQNMAIGTTQ